MSKKQQVEHKSKENADKNKKGKSHPPAKGWRSRLWLLAKTVLPLFVAGLLAGYEIGNRSSPNYDDPSQLETYVVDHATSQPLQIIRKPELVMALPNFQRPHLELQYSLQHNDQGELVLIVPVIHDLSFECGLYRYTYTVGNPAIARTPSSTDSRSVRVAHVGPLEAASAVYGSLEGLKLAARYPKFQEKVEHYKVEEKTELIVGGVSAVATGLGIGAAWGYDDRLNCGSDKYDGQLSRIEFWQAVAADLQTNNSWYLSYDNYVLPRIDTSRGIGKLLSNRQRKTLFRLAANQSSSAFPWLPFSWLTPAMSYLDESDVPKCVFRRR